MKHMDKLNKFAEELRLEFSEWTVPNFDPKDGGVNAKILFLLEKPGPETENSGLISQDNDDETARATKEFLNDAGIDRKEIILWNAFPAWTGQIEISKEERGKISASTVFRLLEILPKVKAIVLVGKEAQKMMENEIPSNLGVFPSMHPSPKNRAFNLELWKQIPDDWAKAKKYVDDEEDRERKKSIIGIVVAIAIGALVGKFVF